MNLAAAVQTTGINWESVGVIIAALTVIVTIMLYVLSRKDRRQHDSSVQLEARFSEMQQEFTTAINHLSDVLMAKLETKESVARISERLARLEGAAGTALAENSHH